MVVELRARPSTGTWVPVVWTLVALLLVGLAIDFADRPVADFAHAVLRRPGWASLLTKLALLPFPLAAVGVLVAGLMWLVERRLSAMLRIVFSASLATLLATAAVLALKYACGRMWPDTWVDNNPSWIRNHTFGFVPFHGGPGYASFPSGHTTRITAPFAVLWQYVPRLRVLWALPTLLVMAGLLAADFHWLSDCLAGIWLGAACAWVVLNFV